MDVIRHLARKCAAANLRLRDARKLFDGLYMADALMLAGGNHAEAARRSQVERSVSYRISVADRDLTPPWPEDEQ